MNRRPSPRRAGFTLIEVLIAVVIVVLLIGLLLPAIRAAYRTAQQAQVTAELNNIAAALASFKTTYGDYPPSRVILCESGYNTYSASAGAAVLNAPAGPMSPSGNDTDLSVSQLIQRSRLYLRRFWPRVDFDNGTIPFDFNNNGSTSDVMTLSGSECLVFFLGGIPINNGKGGYSVSGFSKLPTNPFLPPGSGNTAATNRTVPNYEFQNSRLVDQDGDHIPSYLDPLDLSPANQRAYAYFCSYGTNSYDPNDVNGYGKNFDHGTTTADAGDFEVEDNGTTFVERGFSVGFPNSAKVPYVVSPGPNPYCSGTPVTTGSMSWMNPTSFQLFSAGADRFWGLGGQYVGSGFGASGKLPIFSNPPDSGDINNDGNAAGIDITGVRRREGDNLTNFSSGRLD